MNQNSLPNPDENHEDKMKLKIKWSLLLIAAAGVLIVISFAMSQKQEVTKITTPVHPASSSTSAPPISWSPQSMSTTIFAGDTKSISVSFTASQNLSNVAVWVVPEFQPYMKISPASFASIQKGQTYTLNLTVSSGAFTPPGMLQGTVQLRSALDPSKVFAQPLPVTLAIWSRVAMSDNLVTVQFGVPPGWTPSIEGIQTNIYSSQSAAAIDSGDAVTPPDITVTIVENSNGLSLASFVQAYRAGWFAAYQAINQSTTNGHEVLFVNDLSAPIPHRPELAAFIAVENSVIVLTSRESAKAEFDSIISTFRLSQ